jgi:ABC-type multidrug transport system ATPase subunit
VDVLARDEIWAMLAEQRDEVLVLVSTSYLGEMAACQRLIYLDEGRVVADDAPDHLCAASGMAIYRAWGSDPRGIVRRARELPYVRYARPSGEHARIEVRADVAPAAVHADLSAIAGVLLVDRATLDMEAALHALAGSPAALAAA